ncbi:MAG: ABC transporter permease [Terracidiphilus sp.]|nr:ABC transporter permease [Terracidiphilus sp.]
MRTPMEFTMCFRDGAARVADLGLLRGASLLVPGSQRAEWWREWYGELWQARQEYDYSGEFSLSAERAIAGFCMGAFQDALYLRKMDRNLGRRSRTPLPLKFGAAWQCLLLMAALAGASFTVARLLPGVRAERSLSQDSVRPGLVLIEDVNNEDSPRTISSGQYRAWKGNKQEFFDGFAFYRVTRENVNWRPVEDGSHTSAGWGVGRASSNFFSLLGLPVQFKGTGAGVDAAMPSVILSESLWKREFGADPRVAGSVVRVGERRATIAGVAAEGPWGLPGKVDAWLLEPDQQMTQAGAGYVVAHLSASGKSRMGATRIPITSYSLHRSPDDLMGIALGRGMPRHWDAFWFAIMLAFLALPAISSVSLGDLSVSVHKISWQRRVCRWGFLGAKIALLLPIAYFVSLDMAYCFLGFNSSHALYLQIVAAFFICLFGMQWVLSDQQQRCPICLRRVNHPARVGQLSRTFLAWNGTELMCMGGHTLLHVPSLPTSWFSSQRWMLLDSSWEFLFAEPVRE